MNERDTRIAGYSFKGELLCPECTREAVYTKILPITLCRYEVSTEQFLDAVADYLRMDREDVHSFSSDTFPKVLRASELEGGAVCAANLSRCQLSK